MQDMDFPMIGRSNPTRSGEASMPAIQSCFIEPIWDQFSALLPRRPGSHTLGCHRPRVSDRLVFDKLVQVAVFGCAYWRIADASCSATTLRRRRDEWIVLGVMDQLAQIAEDGYDRLIGLQLDDIVVDGCITKAPCGGEMAGRSPVDRGKQGTKRSILVDGAGIPLGVIQAPANRNNSPLLASTLDTLADRALPPGETTVHLDRGYTRARPAPNSIVGAWPHALPRWASRRRYARPRAGSWSGPTRGTTPSRNWPGAPNAAGW